MNKLLPAFILALGIATSADAQFSGGGAAPLSNTDFQAALQAATNASTRANPTPALPGLKAYERGAYAEAARLYHNACEAAQHAISCHNLGRLYEKGLGVPRDLRQAVALYERALKIDPANSLAKTSLTIVRPPAAPTPSTPPHTASRPTLATAQPVQAERASASLASRAQTQLLASAIAQDSKSWAFNRYDSGSLSEVSLVQSSGGIQTIRGNYTFNDGRNKGWASVNVQGGKVLCITYWDTYSCNSVRPAPVPKTDAELRAEEQQRRDADRNYWRNREEAYQACVRRYEDRRLGEHACTY